MYAGIIAVADYISRNARYDVFVDRVQIDVRAGKGGDGKLSFRHEKYRAKGGPDGGDGGHGGDVIAQSTHNRNTLAKFKSSPKIKAEDGQQGGGNRKAGKSGQDVIVHVPVGTIIHEGDPAIGSGQTVIADLTEDGQQVVIARGGRGGFGNAHFTASTRQAPRIAEKGEPGERRNLTLELKLVADVGLIGLPNAGKSTLLSVISNAKPEIADYAFTTLVPNLGVVDFADTSFLAADIPGLIEGASEGKGLGDEFLRHTERTSVLLHLVDVNSSDPVKDYKTIQNELKAYKVDLSDRPQIVVVTKIETVDDKTVQSVKKKLEKASKQPVFAISAQAHKGLEDVLYAALQLVQTARKKRAEELAAQPAVVINETSFPDMWKLVPEDDAMPDGRQAFRVIGERIEGFARRTDWESDDARERLRDIMRKMGIGKKLEKLGAEPGTVVRLGDHELEWL